MPNKQGHGIADMPPQAITAVLVVFVVGWIASLAAEIFKAGYTAPTGLNETMISLVTAFFVAHQRLGGNSSNGAPPPGEASAPSSDTTTSEGA